MVAPQLVLGIATLAAAGAALAAQPPPPVSPETPPPPAPREAPPPPVSPEPPAGRVEARTGGEAPGFCRWVEGAAASEAALLFGPELFGSVGFTQVGSVENGVPLGEPKPRVTLGLEVDAVEIFEGVAVRQRAEAECRRWRAMNRIEEALQARGGVGAGPALAARAAVLETALPILERRLTELRGEVRNASATLEELDAAQLRLDELRALAARTHVAQAQARERGEPPASLPRLLEDFRAADDEVERLEGRLRKTQAWALELRGGYDEIVDVEQDVPFFATLTLSWDLGNLWQGSADRRAREGRRDYLAEDAAGIDQRTGELIGEVRAMYAAERTRLREVDALRKDLEAQLATVEALSTSHVRRFRDYLVFELTRLRAEHAYLEEHVEALGGFLGEEG